MLNSMVRVKFHISHQHITNTSIAILWSSCVHLYDSAYFNESCIDCRQPVADH